MTEIVSIFNQRSVIWREIKGEIKAKEPERKEQKQSAENWDMKPVRLLARSAGAAPAAFCRSCVRLEAACRPPPPLHRPPHLPASSRLPRLQLLRLQLRLQLRLLRVTCTCTCCCCGSTESGLISSMNEQLADPRSASGVSLQQQSSVSAD